MKGKRGRPKLNTSETKIKTYSISERHFEEFKKWCRDRGLKVSEVIRIAIFHLMKEGRLEDLLAIPEMERFAVEIIKGNLEKNKKRSSDLKNEI